MPMAYNNHLLNSQKKAMSYANFSHHSIDKRQAINNSAYKESHSLERVKFSSLDKPATSASFLRNNVYYQPNSSNQMYDQRGYLSNFKDRFNIHPKIKKSFKNVDKPNFNFMNPNFAYKN